MRRQFWHSLHGIMTTDPRVVLCLADVGEFQAQTIAADCPGRVINFGIREQAMIGAAAGMAREGMIPIIYGIAPFIVERAYEQIKLDLALNECRAVIVTVGASFDYANEGPTHHAPADVPALYQIPGMNIYVPGAACEIGDILAEAIKDDKYSSYIRLADVRYPGGHGAFWVAQSGTEATIVAIGPMISLALKAFAKYNVTIIYTNKVKPFDMTMRYFSHSSRVMLLEPYYTTLANEVAQATQARKFMAIGVPNEFAKCYTRGALFEQFGLTIDKAREAYKELMR